MATGITLDGPRAILTIPVEKMPLTVDAADCGRPTHTIVTITLSELRALAAATAHGVEILDETLATTAGQLIGGHR